jgi:Mrp family chromosome partitioning ATPase
LESNQKQLAQVELARNWQEQQVTQLNEYLKQGLPMESFPEFVGDTTLNNLKTERLLNQADYAGLVSTAPGGQQLETKKAQVEDINKAIKLQAQSLADGQRSLLTANRNQEQKVRADLQDASQTIQQLSHEREEWMRSFGDITLMKKMIACDTNNQTQPGSTIVVVSRAFPPARASSPKLWLNLAVGIFVGGLAGLLVAITRTLLDDRLVSPKAVTALTRLPCVATIPRPGLFAWRHKNRLIRPPARTGFNLLRSRLLLTAPGTKAQIIGFTPARKCDSASQTVADLAIMLARAGHRILVVDLHFSKPRQADLLRIKPHSAHTGLADWMASSDAIDQYIWPSELGELGLLSCERCKTPAADLVTRRPLARVFPELEGSWEFILIDAPAISSCWDLMLALPAKSTLVITARHRRTRARQVVETALVARNQKWNVAGVALQSC